MVANIIALGFLSTYAKIVSRPSLRDVVEEQYASTPHLEMNMNALEEGFKLGSKYLKDET